MPIYQWSEAADLPNNSLFISLHDIGLDPTTSEIVRRLRNLLSEPTRFHLSNTDLHDLTCFVLHRLLAPLAPPPACNIPEVSSVSECVRNGIALFMLIIHGPTYFSHAGLQYKLVQQLRSDLERSLVPLLLSHGSLALWLLSVGMVGSESQDDLYWFSEQARIATKTSYALEWEAVLTHLRSVLWYKSRHAEGLFKQRWNAIWTLDTT